MNEVTKYEVPVVEAEKVSLEDVAKQYMSEKRIAEEKHKSRQIKSPMEAFIAGATLGLLIGISILGLKHNKNGW